MLAPVPVDHVLSRITDGWTKLVIFGDAGDGKSTLLRVLAGTFLAEGRFPILVRAREWEESEFRSLRQYVEDPAGYFQSLTLGPPSSRALAKAGPFLWAKLEVGQASVLVDGLDEATRPETIGNALRALPGDPRSPRNISPHSIPQRAAKFQIARLVPIRLRCPSSSVCARAPWRGRSGVPTASGRRRPCARAHGERADAGYALHPV